MMAPLHGAQAAPHGLSAGELTAARLSDALFAPHFDTHVCNGQTPSGGDGSGGGNGQ